MGGAVINSNTTIGEHCIVNTNSSIDHDCKMEVFSSLAPGVTTGGNVYIGEYSAISLGAKIIHNVVIGKHTVVGAGSTVLKNLPDNCVAYNTPAKIVRNRIAGRSEEHTSELQSRRNLVCRLLLEKKKNKKNNLKIVRAHV